MTIDQWVGDGDSLGEDGLAALAAAGVPIERSRPDKDESDTELAVRAALARGAAGVVIVGALGGARIDHALANVGLLAMPELAGRHAVILDDRSRISLIVAPAPDGDPVMRDAPRSHRRPRLAAAGRAPRSTASRPPACAIRCTTSRCRSAPARGLSNVRTAAGRGGHGPPRPACSSSRSPATFRP